MSRATAFTIWLGALLAAAASHAQSAPASEGAASLPGLIVLQPRVATRLDAVDPAALSSLCSSLIAERGRHRVLNQDDVAAVMGQAARAQLLGCDEAGCLAEIGAAMGAPFLFYSTVGQVGSRYVVSATLIDNGRAQVLERQTLTVTGQDRIVEALRVVTLRALGEPAQLPEPRGMSWTPVGIAAVGVSALALAAGATGTGLGLLWSSSAQQARTASEFNGYRDLVGVANPLAITGYALAGVALLAAPVFFLLPGPSEVLEGDQAGSVRAPGADPDPADGRLALAGAP